MKKILSSKIYNIIILLIELTILVNLMLLFRICSFGEGTKTIWLALLFNSLALMFIFGFDVIISANNGILKYVKTRNEDGFQAKRYTNICLITSSIISITFVVVRAIHSKLFQANGIFGVLVILFILCMIIFIVFFYMLIILLIGNKIYDNKKTSSQD